MIARRRRGLIRNGLVGEWRMVDASGTTLPDSSGNGRNGTLVATPTINAQGMLLNGTTQYATLPVGAIVHNNAGYAVIVALNAAAASSKAVYSEGNSGNANTRLELASSNSGAFNQMRLFVTTSAGGAEASLPGGRIVFDSTPHISGYSDLISSGTIGRETFCGDGQAEPATSLEYTRTAKTLDRATIGALGKSTYSAFLPGTLYYLVTYSRHLSVRKQRRCQRAIRRILLARGVTGGVVT